MFYHAWHVMTSLEFSWHVTNYFREVVLFLGFVFSKLMFHNISSFMAFLQERKWWLLIEDTEFTDLTIQRSQYSSCAEQKRGMQEYLNVICLDPQPGTDIFISISQVRKLVRICDPRNHLFWDSSAASAVLLKLLQLN